MHKNIAQKGALHALGTAAYIGCVVTLIFNSEKVFGSGEPDTVLVPIGMLCLFVLSAAVTSSLVFGRPVLWYLDGKKKDAVALLAWTLGSLCAVTIGVFLAVLLGAGGR